MTSVQLFEGDNRENLRRLIDQGVRVDSAVMDPPYGLISIIKRFGKADAVAASKEGNDGSFSRLSGGFMGKNWDATGIERDPEFWKLVLDILKPGGFVFAFSSPRTGHWQACAMEQAGFIMYPFHGWAYGTGYPKALDAAKSIDKKLGQKGEIVPTGAEKKRLIPGADQHASGSWIKDSGRTYQPGDYVPATPEAAQWQGWKLGAGAHKPALEPIYLAQKPFATKTGAENLLAHGLGAVNIDACRAEGNRYPANLFHDGSDAVRDMLPDGADSFFNTFPFDEIPPLFYHGKAGKSDRAGSDHPTVKPIGLIRHLVRHITPPGGTVLDPFAGSGTTGEAALAEGFDCILMEGDEGYCSFLRERFFSENVKDSICGERESSVEVHLQNGWNELRGSGNNTDPLFDLLGAPELSPVAHDLLSELLG